MLSSLVLAILLIASPVWAGSAAKRMLGVSALICDDAVNEVGIRATGEHSSPINNYISICPATADCSGSLNYAKVFQKNGSITFNVKIGVFPRTGAPVSGNTVVGWSGAIASQASADTWIPAGTTATISGNVSVGDYWIAYLVDATASIGYGGSSGCYYRACTGCYASPPTDLSGTWTADEVGTVSAYVTIGN